MSVKAGGNSVEKITVLTMKVRKPEKTYCEIYTKKDVKKIHI